MLKQIGGLQQIFGTYFDREMIVLMNRSKDGLPMHFLRIHFLDESPSHKKKLLINYKAMPMSKKVLSLKLLRNSKLILLN